MKFRLEASQDELEAKAPELLKALCDEHPAFEQFLEKALPHPEHELKYKALRDMKAVADKGYQQMLDAMLRDIGKVLDRSTREVRKSIALPEGMTIEQAEAILQKADIEEVKETQEDKPEPGDIDVETGDIVPEPPTEEEKKEAKEEKELLKAKDHTKAIAEVDEKKYKQVKAVLIQRGYHEGDFAPGGPLYGKSVNQLLEMLRAA